MTHFMNELPTELQHQIVFFLAQNDLVQLTSVSRLFHRLATRVLYRRIYLNDSKIELSEEHTLAPTWTWFQLHTTNRSGEKSGKANKKLGLLVRTLQERVSLCECVHEIRLNWDLDVELQRQLISILTHNPSSLQIVDNVTDPIINEAIENSPQCKQIVSLDLPPPNALPALDIPARYIPNLRRFLTSRLSGTIRSLTLFMDPLMMFNSVVRLREKLEVEALKLHCRADTYPPALYNRLGWEHHDLTDIIDVKYLKTLTIISWYDHVCPDRVYKFDEWAKFENLEDITLIAVTYHDKKIANLIRSCKKLRRLKLDFTVTLRCIPKEGEVYRAIFEHKNHMEFLDLKVQQSNKVMNLDIRDFSIVLRAPCPCDLCQEKVVEGIFRKKILTRPEDYKTRDRVFETYERANFYELLQMSNLFPYSKAVDRFPSVKTGPEDAESFLDRFNDSNEDRPGFVRLTQDDFYDLYHCLIHTFKSDIEPFLRAFPKLKFLVLNEISFVVKITKDGKKFTAPLFYGDGFEPNLYVTPGVREIRPQHYGRVLYLN